MPIAPMEARKVPARWHAMPRGQSAVSPPAWQVRNRYWDRTVGPLATNLGHERSHASRVGTILGVSTMGITHFSGDCVQCVTPLEATKP
jgi:hypothetical protein